MTEEEQAAKVAQKVADDLSYLSRIGCAVCEDDVRHRKEVHLRIDKALTELERLRKIIR